MTFNCKISIFTYSYQLIKSIKYTNNNQIYHSLLDILIIHHIPIHYQCKAGYCGACRIILKSGTIRYHIKPINCIQSNEILTCCCNPIEDIILKINI